MESRIMRLLAVGLLAEPMAAQANTINLDFGVTGGLSSSYAAASDQAGAWNQIDEFVTTSGIVDTNGDATSITVTISASPEVTHFTMTGYGGSVFDETQYLVLDNFYVAGVGGMWYVTITGLVNGVYDLYLYEPANAVVGTGDGSANGMAFNNVTGGYDGGAFAQGVNYIFLDDLAVTDGTLLISGSIVPSPSGFFGGLAGLQLANQNSHPVDRLITVTPPPMPEPGTLALLSLGLLGLGVTARRRPH